MDVGPIRALAIKQPWASMIIEGTKQYEFRKLHLKSFPRRFYVYATKPPALEVYDLVDRSERDDYPLGCILGTADIVDVIQITPRMLICWPRGCRDSRKLVTMHTN